MAKAASPQVIDLISRKNPELLEYIEAQEAKKPENKIISPFLDDWVPETPIQTEEEKIDMAVDHGQPFSGPFFREWRERFDYFMQQDPEKLNIADLCWMGERMDDHEFWNIMGPDTAKNNWEWLRSKRPAKVAQSEGETASVHNYGGQEKKEDGDVDEALENRWHQIKKGLIVDPDTGLSEPAIDAKVLTECEWVRYMFYREIEKRFLGTLTDADWKWIEKYEAGKDWEFLYSSTYKYARLARLRPTEGDE